MGENCKYNGKNNKNQKIVDFLKDKEVIRICPEILAGLTTPRPCVEIVDGVVTDQNGNDVDARYRRAVDEAMRKIEGEKIEYAVLQSRSPTCGVNNIYDGSFSGKLIPGMGLFAAELKKRGCRVIDAEDFDNFITNT